MGVLARIFRRSRATEEATAETASAADAPTGTPVDGVEAERTGDPTSAQEPAEGAEAADAAEAGKGAAPDPEPENTTEPVVVTATDGVEIPRQQSADEAADSEAGEGART
ncbi:hypothetical protein OG440_09340 [Streptomyces sp. NBC_00637]|uniref:hypothetical protein n=1 Tax=Streptomyces sp. NBC_00637 TaxID=2903667 RepID=UPI00325395B7